MLFWILIVTGSFQFLVVVLLQKKSLKTYVWMDWKGMD